MNMYNYLMGETRHFLMVSSDRARLSGHIVKHRQLHSNIRKRVWFLIFFCLFVCLWLLSHIGAYPWRLWTLCPWRYMKTNSHNSNQLSLGYLALSRRFELDDVISNFIHSVIHLPLSFNILMEQLWSCCDIHKLGSHFIGFF